MRNLSGPVRHESSPHPGSGRGASGRRPRAVRADFECNPGGTLPISRLHRRVGYNSTGMTTRELGAWRDISRRCGPA